MSNRFHVALMTAAVLTASCSLGALSSARSAELTNGKNGTQPNSLDSESPTGSAGVAPSRGILKQGDGQTPDSLQPGAQAPTTEKPKQQN